MHVCNLKQFLMYGDVVYLDQLCIINLFIIQIICQEKNAYIFFYKLTKVGARSGTSEHPWNDSTIITEGFIHFTQAERITYQEQQFHKYNNKSLTMQSQIIQIATALHNLNSGTSRP